MLVKHTFFFLFSSTHVCRANGGLNHIHKHTHTVSENWKFGWNGRISLIYHIHLEISLYMYYVQYMSIFRQKTRLLRRKIKQFVCVSHNSINRNLCAVLTHLFFILCVFFCIGVCMYVNNVNIFQSTIIWLCWLLSITTLNCASL